MSDSAPDVDASPADYTPVTLGADAPDTFNSISQAAKALAAARHGKNPAPEEPDEGDPEQPELSDEDNGAPDNPAPAEEPDAAKPEGDDPPPIEPPRSWTKAEKERFATLPRETQDYIHAREQERERDFRRSQNEIAEQRKAIEAERTKAEQVRQQYEAQLPALMQELTNAQQSAFADIKTVDDVTKLANEDPFRYLQWQAHQTKLQAVNAELSRAREQQTQAEQAKWAQHVQRENELASEFIPELADKTKAAELNRHVPERLKELGFTQEELAQLTQGKAKLSIFDHRLQRLLYSDLKLSQIQSAKTAAVAKPVPQVQRPGTARSNNAGADIQALTQRLSQTGSEKDAFALMLAKRAASRRS